jgi:hypothetical protein
VLHSVSRWLSRMLELFGLRDFSFAAETVAVSQCDSYHAEIVAPDEATISYASLLPVGLSDFQAGLQNRADPQQTYGKRIRRWLMRDRSPSPSPIAEVWATDRAHLHPDEDEGRQIARAVITVRFCLRSALVFPVLLLTSVVTATLGGALLVHHVWSVGRSGNTSAAIVVALPSFFAPFAVPGQHRLVRRMFKGLRAVVIGSAMLSFAAAATLAVNFSTATTEAVWIWLVVGSSALTGVATLAWLRSSWKKASLTALRRWLLVCYGALVSLGALVLVGSGLRSSSWARRQVSTRLLRAASVLDPCLSLHGWSCRSVACIGRTSSGRREASKNERQELHCPSGSSIH